MRLFCPLALLVSGLSDLSALTHCKEPPRAVSIVGLSRSALRHCQDRYNRMAANPNRRDRRGGQKKLKLNEPRDGNPTLEIGCRCLRGGGAAAARGAGLSSILGHCCLHPNTAPSLEQIRAQIDRSVALPVAGAANLLQHSRSSLSPTTTLSLAQSVT